MASDLDSVSGWNSFLRKKKGRLVEKPAFLNAKKTPQKSYEREKIKHIRTREEKRKEKEKCAAKQHQKKPA